MASTPPAASDQSSASSPLSQSLGIDNLLEEICTTPTTVMHDVDLSKPNPHPIHGVPGNPSPPFSIGMLPNANQYTGVPGHIVASTTLPSICPSQGSQHGMQSPTAPLPARYPAPAPIYNPAQARGTLIYANTPNYSANPVTPSHYSLSSSHSSSLTNPSPTPTSLPTTSQPTTQAQDLQLAAMQPPATISLATQKAREQALAARALKKEEEHTKQLNRMTRENNHLRSQGLIVENEKEKFQQKVKELERQIIKLGKEVLAEKKRGSTLEASASALQESLRLEKRETLRLSSLIGRPAIKETRRQMGVVHNFMVCKKIGTKTHTQRQERLIALMMREIIHQKKVMSHPEHTIQILNYTHQSNIAQLNAEYQQHIQSLQAELSSPNSHLTKPHPPAQEFNAKIEELEIKLKGAQECASTERSNASELGLTVRSLRIDLTNRASDIKDLKQKLTENKDLETKLREADAATERERTKNAELVNRIDGINADLEEHRSEIEDLNEKLKNKGDLESEIRAANYAIGHEHKKNSRFETTIADLKTKLGDLEYENKNLEEKRASLEEQLQMALRDKKTGGFGNTEAVLHNANPQKNTAEDFVGLESGHLDNSDPTGSRPNNEQHQELEIKNGHPQPLIRRANKPKFARPNTPPPGPRRGRDEPEEVYTQRLRRLTQLSLDHNAKLLGQDKGHSAVSDLETTQYQTIEEFLSDPTKCFVAMWEKLDASFSENCELKNEIDRLEDDHNQQSKRLKAKVRKLEATVDGLRQEKRDENMKLKLREQALTKAEKALEQREQWLNRVESGVDAVTMAESSTSSWDNETYDDGSTIFEDPRIYGDIQAAERCSMFADTWHNGGCEVGLQVDNTEVQCPSPVGDIEASQCPNPVGDIETECSGVSGTFPWKLILVDLLVIFLLLAGMLCCTIFKQNPPSEQRPPHTCHISERPHFSMPFSSPDRVPILVCLENGSSNSTPAFSLTVPILDSLVSQLPLFDGPGYEHVTPPEASTGFKSWLWEFMVTGAAQGQFGAAVGSSSLYL